MELLKCGDVLSYVSIEVTHFSIETLYLVGMD